MHVSMKFNPNSIAIKNGHFFGFPCSLEESSIAILCVPWDVTTSYGDGTSLGPSSILEASYQVDLFSPYAVEHASASSSVEHASASSSKDGWKTLIGTAPISKQWLKKNKDLRKKAKTYISFLEKGRESLRKNLLKEINQGCETLHTEVELATTKLLNRKKRVVVLGGDHSVSIGALQALQKKERFSILHIDAHADLRRDYEGFTHSHASIMYNALKLPNIERITQIGIRDVSPEEVTLMLNNPKIKTFWDWDLKEKKYEGVTWKKQCLEIIETLTENVYVSFDIDGLDPKYCPHTGTPVPGGLELGQVLYLLNLLVESGRKIIGADLVEVAPQNTRGHTDSCSEWDCNVGARVLYNLCLFIQKSFN